MAEVRQAAKHNDPLAGLTAYDKAKQAGEQARAHTSCCVLPGILPWSPLRLEAPLTCRLSQAGLSSNKVSRFGRITVSSAECQNVTVLPLML